MTMASLWRHYGLTADLRKTYHSGGTSDSRMMRFTKLRRCTSRVQEPSTPCCKGDVITWRGRFISHFHFNHLVMDRSVSNHQDRFKWSSPHLDNTKRAIVLVHIDGSRCAWRPESECPVIMPRVEQVHHCRSTGKKAPAFTMQQKTHSTVRLI